MTKRARGKGAQPGLTRPENEDLRKGESPGERSSKQINMFSNSPIMFLLSLTKPQINSRTAARGQRRSTVTCRSDFTVDLLCSSRMWIHVLGWRLRTTYNLSWRKTTVPQQMRFKPSHMCARALVSFAFHVHPLWWG
eukprot:3995464-Amphidinium_carterae.1